MSKIVSEDQIDKKDGMVLDFGQDEEINPDNLPDPNVILDNTIAILEYMNTDEMKELRKNNNEIFISTMETKFESFAEQYYAVFRMIISGQDLSLMMDMLNVINGMKSRKITVETGEKQIGAKLKQFLPEDFEKKLQEKTAKNMKKQNKKNNKK